jgi:TPR repeat protein/uncharacterized caspase-like protein
MPDERDVSPASDDAARPGRDGGRSRQEGPWRADAHAVVIGINTYLDPRVPDLRFARADAEAVYKVLTDPEVGRFKPENVTLLVDAEATERRIRSALGTALPRRARQDSTVCIYFAGHGAPDIDVTRKSADGIAKYLIPHDAVADDLRSSGISMDAVQEYFSYLDANQVVCFLDCCYSGAAGGRSFLREGFQTRALLSDEFLDGLASEGRLVITACAANEVSLESPDKGHGLFTYHLVEGLRGAADTGGDGLVTIDELYDYLYHQVERDARSLGGRMKPVRKGSVQGRVYLTEYETATKKRIRLAGAEASAAFARGDADEAARLWIEVQTLDAANDPARTGLAAIAERRAREQAAREEAARRRAEDLQRQHHVLLGHFESDQLTPEEYERALRLLDEDASSLSEIARRHRRLLDSLIAGSVTPRTYKQSLAVLEGRPVPSAEPAARPAAAPTQAGPPTPPAKSDIAAPLRVVPPTTEPAVTHDRPVSSAQPLLASSSADHSGVKRWMAVGLGLAVVIAMVVSIGRLNAPEPQEARSSPPVDSSPPGAGASAAPVSTIPPAPTTVPTSNAPARAAGAGAGAQVPATPPAQPAKSAAPQQRATAPPSGVSAGATPASTEPRAGASAASGGPQAIPAATSSCADSVACRNECDRGIPNGCKRLGDMYAVGRGGVERDVERTAELYRTACDGWDGLGCLGLAGRYLTGSGVSKDFEQYLALSQKACDAGEPAGCHGLAMQLDSESRPPEEKARAARLFERACDLGYTTSCFSAGLMFADGRGVAKSESRAAAFFERGCESQAPSHARPGALACDRVGVMYADGQGVQQDDVRAVARYRKACDGKNTFGCQHLGFMYESGRGVQKNLEEAIALYKFACTENSSFARSDQACNDLKRLKVQ